MALTAGCTAGCPPTPARVSPPPRSLQGCHHRPLILCADHPPPPPPCRVVITDHGSFVLINVYVPNAGDRPARARLAFKLRFLAALKRKADSLREQSREVGV